MKKTILIFTILLITASLAFGATINVPGDQSTIQAGLNAAISGDHVLVADGTYSEHLTWPAVDGIILESVNGALSTIIDGGNSGRVIYISSTATNATVIDGFTIQNGNVTGQGGGISDVCGITIKHNIIKDNQASMVGGGINANGSNIFNNLIIDNSTSDSGGGINAQSGTEIRNNTIKGNSATNLGGGICNGMMTSLTVKDNIIVNNSAGSDGGGIYNFYGTYTNSYNDVWNNTSNNYGGYGSDFETWAGAGTGCISVDPIFATAFSQTYFLTQATSPCVSTGSQTSIAAGLDTYTTNPDLSVDSGTVDMGFHYNPGDPALPITLSSFTASYVQGSEFVIIMWTTQSETNNLGWNIYRSETEEFEEAIQINTELIPGAGTTTEPTEYIYEDEHEIEYGETYWYWLESMEISGFTETYSPISLLIPEEGDDPESPDLPKIYGLHQNYPNPFNPDTEISFMMKEDCVGELSIFNIKGEKVRTIFTNQSIPEEELVIYYWDGKNDSGKSVTSGAYYYKLKTNKGNFVRKMILLK